MSINEEMLLNEQIKAAEAGDINSMDYLTRYYMNSLRPNAKKATYWFKKLAEAVSTAMFSLGLHYAKGFGVERSFKDAVYWMEKAVENGDEDAIEPFEKFKKALSAEKNISTNDSQAQADLAEVYMFLGNSLEQADCKEDYKLAFDYAQKSAAQNNADGIWLLALAYRYGRGVTQNIDKAIQLFQKGAELGHAPSQHNYACFLMEGIYVSKDWQSAFRLFKRAAEQGYKLAEYSVAKCYELGQGTEKDLDKAVRWGEIAATNGTAHIQYEVGHIYLNKDSYGGTIDEERTRYWFSQAAENGHEDAIWALHVGKAQDSKQKKLIKSIIEKDDGTLKCLLINSNKDCLTLLDNEDSVSFEELCKKGYIHFNLDTIDWNKARDCFIVVSREQCDSFENSNNIYFFSIIYKTETNNLDGFKVRSLEICRVLNEILNDTKTDEGASLYYMMHRSENLLQGYAITFLYFTDSTIYSSNQNTNIFDYYEKC